MSDTASAPSPTPILDALIASGDARHEGGTIVGIAADGVEVALGVSHAPEVCETYLRDFPTPDMW